MKNINIGISISIDKDNQIVWNNGITQNVFNLAKLLKNSSNNYNVFIMNVKNVDITILPWGNDIDLKCYKYEDVKDTINVLIMLGSQVYLDWAEYLKNRGCKIISYHCGSNYIIDMEQVMFKNEENPNPMYLNIYDETWVIPQNEKMNLPYFKVMERSKVPRIIPFVWDSYFIDRVVKENILKNSGRYIPNNLEKRISILEPNIDVVKYCMYPMLIVEELYRHDKTLFKNLYVTNTDQVKVNKYFIKLMNHLDIVRDKVATFESRYITPWFLSTYTDVVISHQWENPLNYAYLDTLYLGYPLVHNAHMIKDVGYYYEGQDIEEGVRMLKYALTEHDKNMDDYNFRTQKILKKYSSDNQESIDIYDSLIDNLFNSKIDINTDKWFNKNEHNNIENNIENNILENKFEYLCNKPSDINQHLPILKKYASECEHITEMGVRTGVSTWSFLSSNPNKLISYDITDQFFTEKSLVLDTCKKENIDYNFIIGDSLKIHIEQTDLLFIDTLHTYNQLFKELKLHNNRVNKYIILHDTTSFGETDEEIYEHASDIIKKEGIIEKHGLFNAVLDFLIINKYWKIKEKYENNNGLTILERIE